MRPTRRSMKPRCRASKAPSPRPTPPRRSTSGCSATPAGRPSTRHWTSPTACGWTCRAARSKRWTRCTCWPVPTAGARPRCWPCHRHGASTTCSGCCRERLVRAAAGQRRRKPLGIARAAAGRANGPGCWHARRGRHGLRSRSSVAAHTRPRAAVRASGACRAIAIACDDPCDGACDGAPARESSANGSAASHAVRSEARHACASAAPAAPAGRSSDARRRSHA